MGEVSADEIDYKNPPIPLTAIDREVLATKDEDYHRITWLELKHIIGPHAVDIPLLERNLTVVTATNALEQLTRLPSDLRRYLARPSDISKRYSSITD